MQELASKRAWNIIEKTMEFSESFGRLEDFPQTEWGRNPMVQIKQSMDPNRPKFIWIERTRWLPRNPDPYSRGKI
jgi:hypothetical protein